MNTALSLLSVTSLISSLSGLSAIASGGRLTVAVQFGKGFRVELRKLVIRSRTKERRWCKRLDQARERF